MSNLFDLTNIEKLFLFFLLLSCEIIIFVLDQKLGAGISVRPLFIIPIVISSFFIGFSITLIFSLISAILHVVAYRLSDFSSVISFKYLPNLLSNFFCYLIVAVVLSWCSSYYKKYHILQRQIVENKIQCLPKDSE